MTQIRRRLTWFLAKHERLWVYQTERIDNNFSLDRLDGIDYYSNGARGKLLEGLLSVDIDGGEPAAKSRMRVIPAYYGFRSPRCQYY